MIKLKSLLQEQTTLFKQGMRDPTAGTKEGPIAKIQQKLIDAGAMKPIQDTNYGHYGPKTKAAVIQFQKKQFPNKEKEWDGIVGEKTIAALNKIASANNNNYKIDYVPNLTAPASSTDVDGFDRDEIEQRLNTTLGTTINRETLTKSPFTTKKQSIEYLEWLNNNFPNAAKKHDVVSPSNYNNENIVNSLNQALTWSSGSKKGQKVNVWEYYQIKKPNWNKKTDTEKIETGDLRIPNTIANADRINKELVFISHRSEYNDKPFVIVDPRYNLVLAFDNQHNLVDLSQSVMGADKQQDVIFTRKDWCELSSQTKNPKERGQRTYEKVNGFDTCVRTYNGKKYVETPPTGSSDEYIEGNTYAYDVLATAQKRYVQKGIYGIKSKFYEPGYLGVKNTANSYGLKKGNISMPAAIHALVPIPNRITADTELKKYLQKDLSLGTIPKEYIDIVEKDFLSTATVKKFDKSSGCFNVDPKFIQDPKVQKIFNYPGVPVFIMGEQDTDYLVQVAPGKEGEFMLDLAGKEGKCVSPSSLEGRYGVRVDSVA